MPRRNFGHDLTSYVQVDGQAVDDVGSQWRALQVQDTVCQTVNHNL